MCVFLLRHTFCLCLLRVSRCMQGDCPLGVLSHPLHRQLMLLFLAGARLSIRGLSSVLWQTKDPRRALPAITALGCVMRVIFLRSRLVTHSRTHYPRTLPPGPTRDFSTLSTLSAITLQSSSRWCVFCPLRMPFVHLFMQLQMGDLQ
jgi:hypothetical protein